MGVGDGGKGIWGDGGGGGGWEWKWEMGVKWRIWNGIE